MGWWILMVILIIFAISALGAQFYEVTIPNDHGSPSTVTTRDPKYAGVIMALIWGGLAALVGYHAHSLTKKTDSKGAVSPAAAPKSAAP